MILPTARTVGGRPGNVCSSRRIKLEIETPKSNVPVLEARCSVIVTRMDTQLVETSGEPRLPQPMCQSRSHCPVL